MQRLRIEMLDEVYLAPSCHLWSQMQNLAARTEAQQHQLYLKRKEHHACHLMFVVRVYKEQVDNARHAHIEQPERALSWHTTALKDLPGYWILLHQCMFGAAHVWIRTDYGSLWRSRQASFQEGLHAGRTGKAVRWATLALSFGGLGTWIWPTHLLPWGLPTWPCSHHCSCHQRPRPSSALGLWTCCHWAERGHWVPCEAPDGIEDRSSSHSAASAQEPWASQTWGFGRTSSKPRSQWRSHWGSSPLSMHCMPALQATQPGGTFYTAKPSPWGWRTFAGRCAVDQVQY